MSWQPMASAPLSGEFLAAIEVRHGGGKGPILWHQHVLMRDNETGEVHNDYSQGWDLEDYVGWQPLPAPPCVVAAPSPEPVAVRYRDRSGRWRYLNFPFTKGWAFPVGLGTPVPLYEHPPAGVPPSDGGQQK